MGRVRRRRRAVSLMGLVLMATALACGPQGRTSESDEARPGVVSGDGRPLFQAAQEAGVTQLVARRSASDQVQWQTSVAGTLEPRVAAYDGSAVALGPPRSAGSSPYLPTGRDATRLAVAREDGSVERFDLAGNFEPEAFTTDERSLFVISYLPPEAPTAYQVRQLDLTTGSVDDVFSLDKELQQAMGGTARTQAWSQDGTRLYTLYTLTSDLGSRAFVHVLSLDEVWAHCVDLPEAFGTAPEDSVALVVTPDGDELYVGDRESETVAVVDTTSLRVVRSGRIEMPNGDVGPPVPPQPSNRGPLECAC